MERSTLYLFGWKFGTNQSIFVDNNSFLFVWNKKLGVNCQRVVRKLRPIRNGFSIWIWDIDDLFYAIVNYSI